MIAANIGKIFLDSYNEKYKSNYSAKQFFVEKYFELFFNHEKYMQWVINSPFVQGIKKGVAPTPQERKAKLDTLVDKISKNDADASIAIGFPSLDLIASTSGQITNQKLPFNEEDIYLSWIGSGFGIGVESGLIILFSNKEILLDLYDGWQFYRDYLNKTSELKGNQINTWNGQWIAHRYNKRSYNALNPTAGFNAFYPINDGRLEVATQSWTQVIIGIARTFKENRFTSYIYSLSKTNTTIGFIPFEIPSIRKPYELYEKYFNVKPEYAEQLFGTELGFTKVCQMGAIGVNALEPKGFSDFITKGTIPNFNPNDEEKVINFYTYQIWLLSMLNNEQLWDKSLEFAQLLINYVAGSEKARANRKTAVEELLKSTKKEKFIENLIQIMKEPDSEKCEEIGKEVHFMSGATEFPYFATLLRFQYASLNKTKK